MTEEILSDDNLRAALETLLKKGDSCGVDGMYLRELPEWLRINGDAFRASVRDGSYAPKPVEIVDLLNYKGKVRKIAKFCSTDRLLLRAMHQCMSGRAERLYSPFSYAFCSSRGLTDAIRQVCRYANSGEYMVELDIEDCFASISHELILRRVQEAFRDEALTRLVGRYLKQQLVYDFEITRQERGLLQGSPISPVLCNLFFCPLDEMLEKEGLKFVRFADDLRIFADSYAEGLEISRDIRDYIEGEMRLNISEQKSGVFAANGRICLGYELRKNAGGIYEAVKYNRKRKEYGRRWRSSALELHDGVWHIVSDGILTAKDYTVLFENEENRQYLPANVTDSVNVYSTIVFGSGFFEMANAQGVRVNIFDRYGRYQGCFVPDTAQKGAHTALNQAAAYRDREKRLHIARRMLQAGVHNLRETLRYYRKHREDELNEAIEGLSQCMEEINAAETVAELMMIEARARAAYYGQINAMLPDDDFTFVKRSRRPPEDAINALISFANTLLYRTVATEICKTGLDIRISFLHSAERRRENLNLDIADYLKPVITDRVIFSLVNKEILHEQEHFEASNGGIYLNKTGKKIVLKAYSEKLASLITVNGRRMSYQNLISAELNKLTAHINDGAAYSPFRYSV